MKKIIVILITVAILAAGCQDDSYDGLFNVDPKPEYAVTFPDAVVDGFTLMDDNAYIINQNSIANGSVDVRLKGPSNKQIVSVAVKAQRFRAAITWPNISPTVPTSAATANVRTPDVFNRTITSNLGTINFDAASEVTFSLPLTLPAALTNATLGSSIAPPSGANPSYDVVRFYFVVTYSDGGTILSNEVRVVVRG